MTTHCFIGRAHPDSTVRALYCHVGGSPEEMYPRLVNHLRDGERLDRVLLRGDLHSLTTRPLKKVVGRKLEVGPDILIAEPAESMAFANTIPELLTRVSTRDYANMPAFLRGAYNEAAHYAYLWIEGMWIVFRSELDGSWKTLPITPEWTPTEMLVYCSGAAAR